MSIESDPSAGRVFENPYSGSGSSTYLFLGGFCLVGVAIVGFLAAIWGRGGQMALHATTTLPLIVAVGLFARGFSRRGTPSRLVVDADGIEVDFGQESKRHHWSEIGSAITANVLNTHKTCLRVTDTAGKTIIKVDEAFPDYENLVELIQSHIDAKPDDDAIRILSKKAKRAAIGFAAIGCFMTAAAVFIALDAHWNQRALKLLADRGVVGEGEIVNRFTAPDGVTKRLEYRIAGASVRNAEVHPVFWEAIEDAKAVPVVYVPDEPDISRLVLGEIEENDFLKSPKGAYPLAAIGGLMALFMFGYAPFAWKGYDLGFDDKDRAWKIKRYGRVIWESKKKNG